MTLPSLFVSHGAPTIVIDQSPAARFLEALPATLPRPRALLVASAHFERATPTLTGGAHPATIHDFGGFPRALYEMSYPAPGDPALAARAAALIEAAGLPVTIDRTHGFDHGVWTPLKLMYPQADIPTLALSVSPHASPAAHVALGAALAPLREEGVLVIGSGAATHDLSAVFRPGVGPDDPMPAWVSAFAQWLADAIEAGRVEDLIAYAERAPEARRNHPTPEHILPLFVALGAGGGGPGRRLHASAAFGALAMDMYAF